MQCAKRYRRANVAICGMVCLLFLQCSPLRPSRDKEVEENASADSPVRLQVVLMGVRGDQGVLRLALYASAQGFPAQHDYAVETRVIQPSGDRVVVTIENVPAGQYALAVIHDGNGNGKLDTNWMGIPLEGYAVSNQAPARLGPPKFAQARFVVAGSDQTISIRMGYP